MQNIRITTISRIFLLAALSSGFLATWNSYYAPESFSTSITDLSNIQTYYAPETSDNIWHNITRDFSIDHLASRKEVQKEIHRLLANPNYFNKVLQASTPYIYFIYQQTKAYGLPSELALIPFIESEYSPNDRSRVGALGLWQLMPATARGLGVKIKGSYDGRRNVIASTDAALRYFSYLGSMFKNNWYLAIAAYNAGEGTLLRAKRRAGSTDFFKLHLPRETRLYVPRLLAVAAILQDPDKYGVKLPEIGNQPFFTKVTTEKPATLKTVAKKTGIELTTLRKLNPDVRPGNYVPVKKDGKRSILVPVEKASSVHI